MTTKDIAQDLRINAILGNDDSDFDKCVKLFFEHLTANLKLPCEVTGIVPLGWEEPYILGVRDGMEYEMLKKTQPSHDDRFELRKLECGVGSEWMLHPVEDIGACCRRISDGREFILGAVELRVTDKASPNYQLLEDYACWFVNHKWHWPMTTWTGRPAR